ncbi:hypothetical protein B0H13DRAFT_2230801 [Mycena leptocephala]|nr:hypothetical protein B0H13DRAFT_2230801 [Mycena leptocephala]
MIAAILISVLAFPAATTIHAKTGIIVPLYSYPETSSTWAPLKTEITTFPAVQFYVIMNPDDGPDGSPGSQSDTTYQAGVKSLRGHANAAVTQDVQTYTAAWGVDGIFDETQAGLMSTYQVYTDSVMLNPGEDIGASTYYSIANQIVTFEDTYAQYQKQAPIPLPHASQQSVIIHTFPNTTATLSSIASVYIANLNIATTDVYDRFGSDWTTFTHDVNSL